MAVEVFQNSNFHWKVQMLCWQQITADFLKLQDLFINLLDSVLPVLQTFFMSDFFPTRKLVVFEKKQLVQLEIQTTIQVHCLETAIASQ